MSRMNCTTVVSLLTCFLFLSACNSGGNTGNERGVLFLTLAEDADGDGVEDSQDGCPEDANKTDPGQCGCGEDETDGDQDGVADCVDECPANELKTAAGECGCTEDEDDSDGDGTPDCVDDCPDDAAKTSPGACGCSVEDTDSDSDGIADCVDGCPTDANKTNPGACGCGESDIDTDADGTPDCTDNCPDDALKTEPGACGCGVVDITSNGGASITFNVIFNDPDVAFTEYYEPIQTSLVQASNDWAANLAAPSPVSIEIQVSFINHEVAVATAASMVSVFVRDNGEFRVFEQGVASEIRTGFDPNGDTPDAQVNIDIDTLIKNFWFDPDPAARTAPIPECQFVGEWICFLDAYSILAHEMGHALAYNGMRDPDTGAVGEVGSTFDEQVEVIGGSMFFVGPTAVAVHGSNIPLADPAHLDLATLMNPVIEFGERNEISNLDVAICTDIGLPLAIESNSCASPPALRNIQPTVLGPKPEHRGCLRSNCPHRLKAALKQNPIDATLRLEDFLP
ncbi:MAG: hypothetical protein GXP29_15225 [Planctomycetes bacterium]|nr:hypothetical protein [Planctomycetota bacterium]